MIKDTFMPVEISPDELRALSQDFLVTIKSSISTYKTYKSGISKFLDYHSNYNFLFRIEDAEKFLDYLQNLNISQASVYSYFTALKRFCSFLLAEGIINKNPAKRITFKYKKSKQEPLILDEGIIKDKLSILKSKTYLDCRNKAILNLAFLYGFSQKELCELHQKDVYIYRGSIRMRKKGEIIILNQEAGEALKEYLALNKKRKGESMFFLAKNKGVLTSNALGKILTRFRNEVKKSNLLV